MDELRAMRVFVAVADQGSMAAAAREMDLAPAVVTRLVAELEASLGARLMQRTTRRLSMTEAGERYLERARRILTELEEARAVVDDVSASPRGHLRILAPPAFAIHQLARQLPAFTRRHPDVTIELHTPGPVTAPDESFDISLLATREALDGDFVARLLACSEVVLCASPDYVKRRGDPRHPDDLSEHDTMLPRRMDAEREVVFSRIDGRGQPFVASPKQRPVLRSEHLDVMYAAALNGLGIAGLPSFVAQDALRSGKLLRMLPQWRLFALAIWATVPSRHYMPARTRAMLDHLLHAFGGEHVDPWLGKKIKPEQPAARRRRQPPGGEVRGRPGA